ncbi:MAG: type II toxin-antitoxin system prevent-host-death family antitoxin [Deltaproteobacteria bacterium]|nr:type II toxin-antitoxin system prevent-host-death family antitoxin [Deltaproteobacteria bacterium]
MKQVNIAELKDHFSDYLKEVAMGVEVGICKRNILIARLVSANEKKDFVNKTKLGCGRNSVVYQGDLTEPIIPHSTWNMLNIDIDDKTNS